MLRRRIIAALCVLALYAGAFAFLAVFGASQRSSGFTPATGRAQ